MQLEIMKLLKHNQPISQQLTHNLAFFLCKFIIISIDIECIIICRIICILIRSISVKYNMQNLASGFYQQSDDIVPIILKVFKISIMVDA